MFKKKLGHAGKYYNALDKSLGKTNLINLEPILVGSLYNEIAHLKNRIKNSPL